MRDTPRDAQARDPQARDPQSGGAPGAQQQRDFQQRPRHQQQQHNRPRHERFEHRRDQPRQDFARGDAPGGPGGQPAQGQPHGQRREFTDRPGRRQRNRNRQFRNEVAAGGGEQRQFAQPVADTDVTGWVELAKDGSGFVRQASNSYLPGPNDPFLAVGVVRQHNLRAGDRLEVGAGRDHRGRPVVVEVRTVDGAPPQTGVKRPEFQSLLATYPDRKLKLETGAPAKGGPELTRRVVDLIAPIGFGQRALIVAPARSGKTMLLQAIVEGVAKNHPEAELLVLLVDERPEEVSDMVACGYGEVVASSFDMPADRHRDVVQSVMHRAQRLAELGRDVVIVLDSITRMARAFNATKGIGRTLSGGLDAQAMATPKAFFGSARSIAPQSGGGSITIIGTALVETGSRMDDVIFEEFKGTGNCEIKLDRSLAEQRIFPAIDIPASGTRREDKLFRPDQLDAVYLLRRGLQQMPASAAMNWLSKRIGNTPSNDVLLATLKDV
jgi:transcription termination factor Rho